MDLLALPDIAGMLFLMGILGWARRYYGAQSVNLWLLGLSLVLVSNVSAAFCASPGRQTGWMHLLALDALVLAGTTFAFAARRDRLPQLELIPLVAMPAVPLLLLTSAFALGVTRQRFYVAILLGALLLGSVFILWTPYSRAIGRRLLAGIHCAIWLPMLALAHQANIRGAVAWGEGCLYLLVAVSFRKAVRRDGAGGFVIVSSFVLWALCLLATPLLLDRSAAAVLLGRVLAMQKFFVVLGMLLVLLETQTRLRLDEAMHDALTGLPNRRLFEDRLSQALERSRRSGLTTALMTLDLNGFKQINDTLGHHYGDLVLQATARHLRARVRVSDTLARCGGDEFSVIMSEITRGEDCARIVESLRQSVAASVDPRHPMTCSIGYALFPQEAEDAGSLAELADQRMYQNKRAQTAARLELLQAV